jgi:hypothetical protein
MGFLRHLFSNPSAPPPVNFGAIGAQQSAENLEAARLGARLARPDIISPWQTTTFQEYEPDRYLQATSLTPEYEGLRRGDVDIQGGLQGLAAGRLGQIQTDPFTTEGMVGEPGPFQYSSVGAQPEYSTEAATYALPGYADLNTYTSNAASEFFNRAVARLNPQFDRAERGLRTQLINSGIPEGSDAYIEEMRLFNQQKNDALGELSTRSIFESQDLQRDILSNVLAGRTQELGELGTGFQVAQAQRTQRIGEQQQQVELQRQARDRQIAEALRLRQQPMSELSALMTGTTPFTQVATQGPPGIAPVAGAAPVDLGAIAASQQADALARYQGAQYERAAALGAATTLGGAFIGRG